MRAPLRILVAVLALLAVLVAPASARKSPRMGRLTGHVHMQGWASWPTAAGPVTLTDCASGYTAIATPVGDTFSVPWPVGKGSVRITARYSLASVRAVRILPKRVSYADFGTLLVGDISGDGIIDPMDLYRWSIAPCDLNYDGLVSVPSTYSYQEMQSSPDVWTIVANFGAAGQSCP